MNSTLRISPYSIQCDICPVNKSGVEKSSESELIVCHSSKVLMISNSSEVPNIVPSDVDVILKNSLVVENPFEWTEVVVVENVVSSIF